MLPPQPPKPSGRDFDPATAMDGDADVDMDDEELATKVELSSVEINILIYLYLLESNFTHTAFALLSESSLPSTTLFQHFNPSYPTSGKPPSGRANGTATPGLTPGARSSGSRPSFGRSEGKIERGELIRKLWKALRWEEIERHVSPNGEPYRQSCPNPFHLLIPHVCPPGHPSSSSNPAVPVPPTLRTSPPPRRPEAFPPPPPDFAAAGPSRSTRSEAAQTPAATESTKSAISQIQVQTPGTGVGVDGNGSGNGNGNGAKGRRSIRIQSEESDSRAPSPERSASPILKTKRKDRGEKDKKRARLSEGDATSTPGSASRMDIDEEPKRLKVRNGARIDRTSQSREDSPAVSTVSTDSKRRRRDRGRDHERDREEQTAPPVSETPPAKPAPKGKGKESAVDRAPNLKSIDNPAWIAPEDIVVWREHRDAVTCLAWNPKNRDVLATGSSDGTARLWDFIVGAAGRALETDRKPIVIKHTSIESSKKNVAALSWHPDGTVLATACADGVGRLFTPSGQLQGIMSFGRGGLNALKFSPSGSTILTAKDDFTVCLWGVGKDYNQIMTRCFDAHSKEVNDVDWLDDDVFASGGNDHTIHVFRTSDKHPQFTFKGHTDDVTRVLWSPEPASGSGSGSTQDRLLASASDDGYIMVWKMPSYPAESDSDRRNRPGSRSLSPSKQARDAEDDYFANGLSGAGGENCVRKFQVVDAENRRMNVLEWSPACAEGRMILAAGGQDSTVKVFDAMSGECLHTLKGLESGTASIAFSPLGLGKGKLGCIAAGGWSGQLIIWDVETGEKLKEYELEDDRPNARGGGPQLCAMAWREDGAQLAVGTLNKVVMTVHLGDLVQPKKEEE